MATKNTKEKKPKVVKAPKAEKPKAPATPKAPKAEVEHRHISELGKADRDYLEAILRKDPATLDEIDLAHLKAREAYLTSDERKKFL